MRVGNIEACRPKGEASDPSPEHPERSEGARGASPVSEAPRPSAPIVRAGAGEDALRPVSAETGGAPRRGVRVGGAMNGKRLS